MTNITQHEEHYTKEIPISLPDFTRRFPLRFGIIHTSWNLDLLQSVIERTKKHLLESGIDEQKIYPPIVVPGSFELPYAAQGSIQFYIPLYIRSFFSFILYANIHCYSRVGKERKS